jgi:ketosteroid isomerase-like protein
LILTSCDWQFVADNIVYDTGARKVAFHATSEAKSPIGLYSNEYAWFLQFNESGEKITKIEEFVDSAYITEFLAKLNPHESSDP